MRKVGGQVFGDDRGVGRAALDVLGWDGQQVRHGMGIVARDTTRWGPGFTGTGRGRGFGEWWIAFFHGGRAACGCRVIGRIGRRGSAASEFWLSLGGRHFCIIGYWEEGCWMFSHFRCW